MRLILKILKFFQIVFGFFYKIFDYVPAYIYKIFPLSYFIKLDIQCNILDYKNDTICLFASYDKHNIIDDYVLYYLKCLNDCGIDIIFITNSKKLAVEDIEKIKPYVKRIILRKGRGRDFASWYIGLKLLDNELDKYSYLILCNDSVYGPFSVKLQNAKMNYSMVINLKSVLNILKNYDFGGITDSFEVSYHIQSYFMVFSKNVFMSEQFKKFWDKFKFFHHKRTVIEKYEIGLTASLLQFISNSKVYCDYINLVSKIESEYPNHLYREISRVYPVNPTHFFWDNLIIDLGCPFLKVELLRDNPSKIYNVNLWPIILEKYTNADINIIKNHLKRSKVKKCDNVFE